LNTTNLNRMANMKLNLQFQWTLLVALVLSPVTGLDPATAAPQKSSAERERELIRLLESDAPKSEKAITCKFLAIYGSKAAVPVLAPLLADSELSSWARIALEAIPDPAAGEALRAALDKVDGRLLVGVINSISVRRDPEAVDPLIQKLKSSDVGVASAAAVALGQIGGDRAAQALVRALSGGTAELRSAVAKGCILCAEGYLARDQRPQAMKLYDTVRAARLPKQRVLEATRGAILARQSDGLPLLLEQLRSNDKQLVGIGLRTARELPGREVTEALAAELYRTSADRQGPLLLALADRSDEGVLPAVLKLAQTGPVELRMVAIGALDRMGDASCVPVLLEAATDDNAQLARAAKLAIGRLEGEAVDADLLARLPQSSGKMRQALIELAGSRRIEKSLPLLLKSAEDSDPGVRRAACETLGTLGKTPEAIELLRLLGESRDSQDQAALEKALSAICGREGARCLPYVMPLMRSSEVALRIAGLHLLATVGGPDSLAAVKIAINDGDEAVRDETVRTLSGWPSNWPDDAGVAEPLLALAKSGKKPVYQIQGLRGYLQHVQVTKNLGGDEKVAKVEAALPLIQRPEERLLAISVLGTVPTPAALRLLTSFTTDPALVEEACQAIVKIVATDKLSDAEARRHALQTVVAHTKNDTTRKRAAGLLKMP
jgi:HEAT repeat protein